MYLFTSVSSCLLISCGYLPLAKPKNKPKDKVACWCSPQRPASRGREELGKGEGGSREQTKASSTYFICNLQFLPSDWPWEGQKETVVSSPLRLWATLPGFLGLISVRCLLMDQNNFLLSCLFLSSPPTG